MLLGRQRRSNVLKSSLICLRQTQQRWSLEGDTNDKGGRWKMIQTTKETRNAGAVCHITGLFSMPFYRIHRQENNLDQIGVWGLNGTTVCK